MTERYTIRVVDVHAAQHDDDRPWACSAVMCAQDWRFVIDFEPHLRVTMSWDSRAVDVAMYIEREERRHAQT